MSTAAVPSRRRAAARIFILAASTLIVLITCSAFFAGRFLVAEDDLGRSDAIFVLAGARVERWLEGADLYREGWAPRIVLSRGRVERAEHHLQAMGIRFPTDAELVRDALLQLKVPSTAVMILPDDQDNTAHEAQSLRKVVDQHGWTRVVVVTSKYHTRRTKFAFSRAFRGTPVRIIVRGSRYDRVNPARWWRSRQDIREVISELPKLLAYAFGLAA
ncbi:MAG: YdcF family protein [Acidobacteria bacterium]|nr:YdcF family protein [Acidobacteriota bacterium]MCA1652326.1 YdcF family protein [Acidobacteriota bacterium]